MNKTSIVSIIFLSISLFIISCGGDDCENKDCGTFRVCVEGTCQCDDGYELDSSDQCVESRSKYFGFYSATDQCTYDDDPFNQTYGINVEAATTADINQLIIRGLSATGDNVLGTLNGNDVTFSYENGDYTISGTGVFTDEDLTYSFEAFDGYGQTVCNGVATKQ